MNSYMSMREVCKLLKISRRVVQGYQKKKLITPHAHNKYGHLLFSPEEVRKMIIIRFYQNIGFSLNEIQNFIDADGIIVKEKLRNQLSVLQENADFYQKMLVTVQSIIEADDNDNIKDTILHHIEE